MLFGLSFRRDLVFAPAAAFSGVIDEGNSSFSRRF
jgi:hypothetical protein